MSFTSFNNYIYTNNESTSQLAINSLFSANGISTWYYLSFLIGGYTRSKGVEDFLNCRNILWAFMNPRYLISINQDVEIYLKLHHQTISHYRAIGSLFSGQIKNYENDIGSKSMLNQLFPMAKVDTPIVLSFFDTTFVDEEEGFSNYEDCLGFYRDIETLLSDRNNYLIIIKPSKDYSFFTDRMGQWSSPDKGNVIKRKIKDVIQNDRVYYAGNDGDIPLIMALSQVVITHCMSSTTAEALGAGKKAFWYESGQKHRGLLYEKIPGLVVHGYSALRARIDELVLSTSNMEFNEYLTNHIKGKVVHECDGHALEEVRSLLVSVDIACQAEVTKSVHYKEESRDVSV